jgi:hypothetical protein
VAPIYPNKPPVPFLRPFLTRVPVGPPETDQTNKAPAIQMHHQHITATDRSLDLALSRRCALQCGPRLLDYETHHNRYIILTSSQFFIIRSPRPCHPRRYLDVPIITSPKRHKLEEAYGENGDMTGTSSLEIAFGSHSSPAFRCWLVGVEHRNAPGETPNEPSRHLVAVTSPSAARRV